MLKSWSTIRLYHKESVFEVEYTLHLGEDWGGFGWRVPPSIELHEVRCVEGPGDYDEDLLREQIYEERH